MKRFLVGVCTGILIGSLLGGDLSFASLPNFLFSRMFNSYVETSSGNVALRAKLVR